MHSAKSSALAALWLASLVAAQTYGNGTSNGTASTVITNSPVVDLGYVKYQGYTNNTAGINYYRGINYAKAPTGDLRWRAPLPIENNNNYNGQLVNVSQTGPLCYQSQPLSLDSNPIAGGAFPSFEAMPQSEDCLILDVLTPQNPSSNYLPVLVQIHGGGYTLGSAGFYPGDALVNRSNGDLIYVSIQYRLGLFGFLAGEEIMENGNANAGLLDQRAALEWVQRNIRAFGGNPNHVTIWGGSAGGGSVTLQMMAYGGVGPATAPFAAAIAEYPWWQPFLNKSGQSIQYRHTLDVANCSSLACLRGLNSTQLEFVSNAVQNTSYMQALPGDGYGVYYVGPVVDGEFVRELPSTAFDLGHYTHVPLLLDHDGYEGYEFSNTSQTMVTAETMDAEVLFPAAGPSFFSRLYEYYPRTAYNSTVFQRQDWFGDFIINCPTYYMGSSAVDRNANSSQVWKLIFDAGSQLHAATAPFLTSDTTNFPGANNQTLADFMSQWWISFATEYDPNVRAAAGAPNWPSYVSGGNASYGAPSVGFTTLRVNYNEIIVERDQDAGPKCDFFSGQEYVVRN